MWKPKRFDQLSALSDELTAKEQLDNVASFQSRRRRVLSGLVVTALAFVLVSTMGKENEEWTILLIFPAMIFTVIMAMMCRCPNCGDIPMGSSTAMGNNGVTYAKGLHLFPSRCKGCGYFLGGRALQRAVAECNE